MPVIKSAKKKLRKDRKREQLNNLSRETVKSAIKKARKSPSEKTVRGAFQAIDKAAKKGLFHKNKASRVKSALSKLIAKKHDKTTPKSAKGRSSSGRKARKKK